MMDHDKRIDKSVEFVAINIAIFNGFGLEKSGR